MNFYRATPISAHATSASFDGAAIESVAPSYMFKFSAVAKASHASANGSLQLQASNTEPNTAGTYTWINVGIALPILGTAVASIAPIDTCYARMRFVFTDASSGVSTALLTVETMAFTF